MKNTSISKLLKLTALTAIFVSGIGSLSACDNKPKFIDYAHNGSVTLQLDYTGRDFFVDGIAQVKVQTYIDGDTTHFKNINGDTSKVLKSRYYGIDTPESTGEVQPYGKQASNFTHEVLAAANENGTIVVSSPFSIGETGGKGYYGAPAADSTGSRYLSLVWYNTSVKNAPLSELTLLNLEIVQNGLSWAKSTSETPAFADIFSSAQKQAEKNKLKLWSDDPDPLFNYDGYEDISLQTIKNEVVTQLQDPSHVNAVAGKNVRFTGTVSGFSNHNLYVQESYEDENGNINYAGINIFTGMGAVSSAYTTIGTYLQVVGNASDSETFGFQISGTQGHWPAALNGDPASDCLVLLSAEENVGAHELYTFEYTSSELESKYKNNNFENLYCRTKITNALTVRKVYVNPDGDEVTLYFEGTDFTAYIPFTYHGDPENSGDTWMREDAFIGKTFMVSGVFAYHKTTSGKITYQLVICGDSDLVCTTPKEGTTVANTLNISEAYDKAFTAIKNVYYYAKGRISQINKAADGSISSVVVSENGKSITVNASNYSEFAEKLVVGSYIHFKGVPAVSGSTVNYNSAEITAAYIHGQVDEDPLTTQEAIDICKALPVGERTTSSFYVKGTITSDVTFVAESGRRNFTIELNGISFLITGSKCASGVDATQLVKGASVLVKAKLENNSELSYTTYYNGCQVISIY